MAPPPALSSARRVWIVGPPGSGKSTFAEALARRLGVPATHLDDVHWLPGWRERASEEFVALVEPALAADRWVVDGNYVAVRSRFLARADLVVWLDLPLHTCVPRIVRRTLGRIANKTVCCNGNVERLDSLLHPDRKRNLLLWALTTDRSRRRGFARELAPLPSVRLRSARAVDRCVRAIDATGRRN